MAGCVSEVALGKNKLIEAETQEGIWIDPAPKDFYSPMEVGTCNSSCGSHLADDIPSSYILAPLHLDLGEVAIQTEETETMVNDNSFS